jgi:hypothetical protein
MNMRILLPNLETESSTEPSTHELRRFLCGELTPERRATIESTAAFKPRLVALAAELRADEGVVQLEVPLQRFLDEHERRAMSAPGLFARLTSMRWTMGAGALAATAAAVFLLVRPVEDGMRLKGDARMGFLVREQVGARFGTDGERLARGTQIQFAVRDDDARAAMVVVGIDGRGAVTVYAAERRDVRVKGQNAPNKTRVLPESVVLDDAIGAERFFVAYGDGDLDDVRRTVEAAARALAASGALLTTSERLPLPARFTQSSVHIIKVPSG